MSAFLEDIRNTTENNKYKLKESIIRDLIADIQKAAENGHNQVKIIIRDEEHRKTIVDFCKSHGFSCYTCGAATITW